MKCNRRLFLCLAALALLSCGSIALGISIGNRGGEWPQSWPSELEPFRERAITWKFMAGSQATIYHIPFGNREEFETLWPTLLKLRSKGAPLYLRTVDKPKTDPNDKHVVYTTPQIHITCPTRGTYRKMPDGSYLHEADWTSDISWNLNILATVQATPRFVGFSKSQNKWIPVVPNVNRDIRDTSFLQQARVEMTLYVDNETIDLNRIKLPADTPIIDRRILDNITEQQ